MKHNLFMMMIQNPLVVVTVVLELLALVVVGCLIHDIQLIIHYISLSLYIYIYIYMLINNVLFNSTNTSIYTYIPHIYIIHM